MNEVSIEAIKLKLENLPSETRQEVYDFIEFLITRKKMRKRRGTIKEKLLDVSVWSKKDLKVYEDINKDFNKWSIGRF